MQNFLKSFQLLTEQEIAEAMEHTAVRRLKKGEFFIQEGKNCKEAAFIKSGILRSFYTKENGDEFTYCINFENMFVTAYSSFITGLPSAESVQALMDTELLVLKKNDIEKFSVASVNWIKLLKFIAEQQYTELEKRVFSYQKDTAPERYLKLLVNHPNYIQKIPLQYLASYLGITPRHLSRIRRDAVLGHLS